MGSGPARRRRALKGIRRNLKTTDMQKFSEAEQSKSEKKKSKRNRDLRI